MYQMGGQKRSQFRESLKFEVSSFKKGKILAGPNWLRFAR